jgi:hypothetical protein
MIKKRKTKKNVEKMEFASEKMRKVISECLIGKKNEENDLVFFQDLNNRI